VNPSGGVHRCVLYARLSVTKEESVSIDRQLDAGRKYAAGRGWEVIGEFTDNGVSATASRPEDRKGWTDLLAAGGFEAGSSRRSMPLMVGNGSSLAASVIRWPGRAR